MINTQQLTGNPGSIPTQRGPSPHPPRARAHSQDDNRTGGGARGHKNRRKPPRHHTYAATSSATPYNDTGSSYNNTGTPLTYNNTSSPYDHTGTTKAPGAMPEAHHDIDGYGSGGAYKPASERMFTGGSTLGAEHGHGHGYGSGQVSSHGQALSQGSEYRPEYRHPEPEHVYVSRIPDVPPSGTDGGHSASASGGHGHGYGPGGGSASVSGAASHGHGHYPSSNPGPAPATPRIEASSTRPRQAHHAAAVPSSTPHPNTKHNTTLTHQPPNSNTHQSPNTTTHAPRPSIHPHPSQHHTQYVNMLLALDTIPRTHNILASFFTWILLAGFVLFPGTFESLGLQTNTGGDTGGSGGVGGEVGRRVLGVVGSIPIFVLGWVCCAVGALGILWLWWRWMKNYVWVVNKLFIPGTLNSLAGLLSTLSSLYGTHHGAFSTSSIITLAVTASASVLFGALTLIWSFVLVGGVKRRHDRTVGRERAGRHGEGYVDEGYLEKVRRREMVG